MVSGLSWIAGAEVKTRIGYGRQTRPQLYSWRLGMDLTRAVLLWALRVRSCHVGFFELAPRRRDDLASLWVDTLLLAVERFTPSHNHTRLQ